MKKTLLLAALLIGLNSMISGQTFLWEAFDAGQMPPTGWTINGLPAQWSVGNSNNAGGVAPEAKFTYINGTSQTRLITPAMDLTGITSVKVSFKHFYDDYSGTGPKAGVATRSNNGAWTSVWEINPSSNVGPEQIDLTINNSDVGQDDFQVCFYLDGNMYNIDYWYIDNVLIFNPLNLDLAIIGLPGTPTYFGGPVPVKGTIMNVGQTQVTSAEIHWTTDNGMAHSTVLSGLSLDMQETYDFTCTDLMDAQIGSHQLGVFIHQVNGVQDDFQGNDTSYKAVYRVSHVSDRKPLFEEFTSSTCAPCAGFNSGFVPWCEQNEEDITLVKYQMNWPGNGDPYYTEEGGVRRDFYGVGFVPDLYCNGANVPTDMTAVQQAFDFAITQPGLMSMVASHTLNGHVINVQGAVLPFANITGCALYIVVMEKVTHNNASSNGETEFHHVMMKMIPDASGTSVNLSDRQTFTFDETMDLTGTFVEEWDDLIVGLFVQDLATKEVYQSIYSVENGTFDNESRLNDITVDGVSLTGFNPDVFTYDLHLPSGTTQVPVIDGVPMQPEETVIVVPAYELPGVTTIDVFAEDLIEHSLYTINLIIGGVGMEEKPVKAVTAWPNPTHGKITISGADHARVTLLTAHGEVVRTIGSLTSTTLDLTGTPGGVYLLKIERTDGTVIQKKIVIL